MLLFLELFSITALGFLLVSLLLPKNLSYLSLPLSYPVGMGCFTFFCFLVNLFGAPYSQKTYFLVILGALLLAIIILKLYKLHPTRLFESQAYFLQDELKELWKVKKITLISLVIIIILPLISSLYWPTKDWDSFALYDFRSISFVRTGFMEDAISRGYFFGYPLNTSIAQTLVYLNNQYNTAIVHYPFYASLILGICFFLKKFTSSSWSLFWTVVIASLPSLFGHAQMTYTNLAYSTYIIFAHILLFHWNVHNQIKLTLLLGIVVGLSIWSRSTEPFWIYPTLWLTIVAVRKKMIFSIVSFFIPLALFRYTWTYFEKSHINISTDLLSNTPSFVSIFVSNWQNIKPLEIILYVYNYVIFPDLPVYILFTLCLLLSKFVQKRFRVFSLSVLFFLGITIAGTTLYSLFFTTWNQIGGSAQRMTMFLAPLILIYTACCTYSIKKYLYEE